MRKGHRQRVIKRERTPRVYVGVGASGGGGIETGPYLDVLEDLVVERVQQVELHNAVVGVDVLDVRHCVFGLGLGQRGHLRRLEQRPKVLELGDRLKTHHNKAERLVKSEVSRI